eukprot:GHVT01048620.1.p1 GENE.GHVT01048620.1~~GHVT01048620.1.p1  ORF type:complete len:532 (-),score=113.15 GHVT01048620.1:27-1622(-)
MAHILSDQAVRVTTALAPEYSSSATSFEQAVSSVSSSLQLYPSAGLGVVPWRDLDKQIKKRIEILRIGMSQAEELVAAVTRQTPTVAKATNADTRDANEKKQQKSNGTENNNNATTSNANAEQQQLDDALQDAHKFALLIHAAVQRLEEFRGLLLSLSHKILKRNLAKSPSDVSLDDIQLQKREEFAEAARREADRETRCDAIRYILDRSIERKATHRNDHPLFVLGIDPKLATVEIVKNFRKRVAFLTHPDKVEESQKQNATEATALINQALPEALQLLRCARGFDPNSYAAPPSPPFYELVGREAPSAPATTGKPNNASASSSEAVERAIPGSPLWLPSRLVFPDVEICPPRGPTVTGACHVTVFAPEASAGLSKITKVQLYVHRPYFASRPPQSAFPPDGHLSLVEKVKTKLNPGMSLELDVPALQPLRYAVAQNYWIGVQLQDDKGKSTCVTWAVASDVEFLRPPVDAKIATKRKFNQLLKTFLNAPFLDSTALLVHLADSASTQDKQKLLETCVEQARRWADCVDP